MRTLSHSLAALTAVVAIAMAMLGIRHITTLDNPPPVATTDRTVAHDPTSQSTTSDAYGQSPTCASDAVSAQPGQACYVDSRIPTGPGFGTPVETTIPACPTDEIPDKGECYWNAHTMGNRQGQSYVARNGHIVWQEAAK